MFDKLLLKQLKDIIREYKLTTQIKMSRLVDGKRKPYTKKELANELHNYLEIMEDGEIKYKQHLPMTVRYKPEERKTQTKTVIEKPVKNIVKKIIEKPVKSKKVEKPIEEEEAVVNEIIEKSAKAQKVPPNAEYMKRRYKEMERDEARNIVDEYKKSYDEYQARKFIIYQSSKGINTASLKKDFKDEFGKKYAVIAEASMKRLKEKADKYKIAFEILNGEPPKEPILEPITTPKPTSKPATIADPKVINKDDYFVIFDKRTKNNNSIVDLTNYFKLEDTHVYNNYNDIVDNYTPEVALPWRFMQKPDAVNLFSNYINHLRKNDYRRYIDTIESAFTQFSSEGYRDIQVFIIRNGSLIGFIRSTVKYGKQMHINYVFVSDKEQGKGYVGELMSMLFEYLIHIDLLKKIKKVDLDYYADAEAGWLAYDRGIGRYGFKNKKLKYTPEQLKTSGFIKKIHDKFHHKNMEWSKEVAGSGMVRKPIEDFEMRI